MNFACWTNLKIALGTRGLSAFLTLNFGKGMNLWFQYEFVDITYLGVFVIALSYSILCVCRCQWYWLQLQKWTSKAFLAGKQIKNRNNAIHLLFLFLEQTQHYREDLIAIFQPVNATMMRVLLCLLVNRMWHI